MKSKTLLKLGTVVLCCLNLFACEKIKKEEDDPSKGKIVNFYTNEIDYKTASFCVDIQPAANPEEYTVGVVLSRYGDPMVEESSKLRSTSQKMTEEEHYVFYFYNLIASEKYKVRAYISDNNGERVWSEEMLTFETDPKRVPVCAKFSFTPTSETTARYESRWDNRGFTISEYGLEYATSLSDLESASGNKKKQSGSGGSVTGLTPGTKYYVRVYAKNIEGTGYSNHTTVEMPLPEALPECNVYDLFPCPTAIYAQYEWKGENIKETGLIYSTTNSSPTLQSEANFTTSNTIRGLTTGTKYYVRAYAKTAGGSVGYSGTKTITTSLSVNMGLKVAWATVNVGSSTPDDYGSYFMWGATGQSSSYTWEKYKYYSTNNGGEITMYKPGDSYRTLLNSDDAAYAKMGNEWHTPTATEWEELIAGCDCSWIRLNDASGCKFKSKKTGNCIFLPAGGSYGDSGNSTKGSTCAYWSANVNASGTRYVYAKFFNCTSTGTPSVNEYGYRYGGRNVRGVK